MHSVILQDRHTDMLMILSFDYSTTVSGADGVLQSRYTPYGPEQQRTSITVVRGIKVLNNPHMASATTSIKTSLQKNPSDHAQHHRTGHVLFSPSRGYNCTPGVNAEVDIRVGIRASECSMGCGSCDELGMRQVNGGLQTGGGILTLQRGRHLVLSDQRPDRRYDPPCAVRVNHPPGSGIP